MSKVVALAAALLFGAGCISGQSPFRFRSTESLGLGVGQLGGNFQLQTIDGVSRGPWFLGGGAGLDYYRFHSVPLFVSASRDLRCGKSDGITIFLNGGTNLPWNQDGSSPNAGTFRYSGGAYWSGGLSYVLKLDPRSEKAFVLSAGYEVKKLEEKTTSEVSSPCYNLGNCQISGTAYYQYWNRLWFVMAGIRF